MADCLILRLEGPLMAFGGEAVDAHGPIREFPGASMLTGLLANALGWDQSEHPRHQRLQERLVFAARLDRGGERLQDFQTAELGQADKGWTTWGRPEGRAGGAGSYRGPHLRYRDYAADALCHIALALEDGDEEPTLDDLAVALEQPSRSLFLGRKPCLPSAYLLAGRMDAGDVRAALAAVPIDPQDGAGVRDGALPAQWPADLDPADGDVATQDLLVGDLRDWHSQIHAGSRRVRRGWLRVDGAGAAAVRPA